MCELRAAAAAAACQVRSTRSGERNGTLYRWGVSWGLEVGSSMRGILKARRQYKQQWEELEQERTRDDYLEAFIGTVDPVI